MCPSLRPLKSHPGGQYRRPGRLLPSEVRPEGPFISRFRNILTHINFLFFFFFYTSIFKANWKQEEPPRGRDREKEPVPLSNPTSYPPLRCQSVPARPGESSFHNGARATRVIHAQQLQATSGIPQTCVPTTKSPFPVALPGHPFWELHKHPAKFCQTAFP